MHHSNEMLSQELVAMAKNDLSVREALVADGSLGHALYHPYMEAVHISNAARLAAIIEQYGWPVHSLVGEEGAWAAWLVAQHAIGNPPFMRNCLFLLKQAAASNEVIRKPPFCYETPSSKTIRRCWRLEFRLPRRY